MRTGHINCLQLLFLTLNDKGVKIVGGGSILAWMGDGFDRDLHQAFPFYDLDRHGVIVQYMTGVFFEQSCPLTAGEFSMWIWLTKLPVVCQQSPLLFTRPHQTCNRHLTYMWLVYLRCKYHRLSPSMCYLIQDFFVHTGVMFSKAWSRMKKLGGGRK